MSPEKRTNRLYLSPPHLEGTESDFIADAIASNWIAPLGPHVDSFEQEFAAAVGAKYALALSSGTAAIHLGLIELGIGPGDEVVTSTLTFAATITPAVMLGAHPVFVDSEPRSWNLDPNLVEDALRRRSKSGKRVKAVIAVHLYGQTADLDALMEICGKYGVPLVEDAAEALGATHRGRPPGTFGRWGAFSFNGNKIITTSGGGMLVSDDEILIGHARKLSTQAREPAVHYEHREIGFNYRMSNILAAIGRAQLKGLETRVARRRAIFDRYVDLLGDLNGLNFMPEADWGRHTRWLTVMTLEPEEFGADREVIRLALEEENIEARPVWKPMHMQPVFRHAVSYGGSFAESLFERGICLPSGSQMSDSDVDRVAAIVRRVYETSGAASA